MKTKKSRFNLKYFCSIRNCIVSILENYCMPVLVLIIRLFMAKIFWYSGLTKISSWESTLYLFQCEYKVPIIPYQLAAIFATTVELSAPIFLTIGLFTRLAAIPMFIMVIIIQTTYLNLNEHYFWGISLLTIMFYGAGKISLDCLLLKKSCK